MSLFQKLVENKYLNDLDSILIEKKYADFQNYFGNPERQENIRNSKEEQFQEGFLRELFVRILGYTLNPEPDYNLISEQKNISDSKKADGAILKGEDATAVIELKGTDTTDLDKIETQAFGYKNHHPKCKYVITSNFEKLRFYIQNAVDHIDFDLFKLSKKQFSLLWLCLAKDNLLNDLPLKIKESSVLQEENITKKLYADYSKFREAIYGNLVKNNPETDKLLLFKKTQKLLDRFLFIFFAEDRLLLPPNSITEIVKQWTTLKEELDEYFPLYSRFKKYFGYMNTGYKGKNYQIYAYNGGLFKPDEILDNITIDDDILHEHTLRLSNYDFETDVDVNILGHIFEHSLGEIENVQAEIKGEKVVSQKTKRKKDGIFYTPKYITKYIVENTLGKLCEEKRAKLKIIDEEYAKGRKNRKKELVKSLDKKLDDYRNWLLSLSILDPACGSGAFLNQALEFLINEHRKIDELRRQLLGGSIPFSDITNDILEKNIYGVDLNEESVEIAKLSLWLRTAQKGRKLNTLSNNIKCGNSLIDDPEVAGDKAFNWQNEFPEIFAKGGFDVVIGNPPYGVIHEKENKNYFKDNFDSFQGNLENYCFFTEIFISLTKRNTGKTGLIIPLTWITIPQFKNLRKVVLSKRINFIVELPTKVFSDADLDTLICVLTKSDNLNNYTKVIKVNEPNPTAFEICISNPKSIKQSIWSQNNNCAINLDYDPVIDKLIKNLISNNAKLKDQFNVSQGIVPYAREELYKTLSKEKADEIVDKRLWHCDYKKDEFFKPELKGEDVSRYFVKWNGTQWIKYGKWLARPRTPDYFNSLRVLVREITRGDRLNAGYTTDEAYNNPGIINIISKAKENKKELLSVLLAILNSKFVFFYHTLTSPKAKLKTSIPKILVGDIENIPIPNLTEVVKSIEIASIDEIQKSIKRFKEIQNQFIKFIHNSFDIQISSRLQNWVKLDYINFIKELNKAIKKSGTEKLSKSDEMEWMEVFESKKSEAQNLKSEIEKTDKEIDKMVYELYGLTDEEIAIVEKSVG